MINIVYKHLIINAASGSASNELLEPALTKTNTVSIISAMIEKMNTAVTVLPSSISSDAENCECEDDSHSVFSLYVRFNCFS